MRMYYRVFLLSFALITLAAAKSDFSGEWKLNVAKSDFGEFPAPESMSQKVTHEDPKLKIASQSASSRGEFKWEANYTTDGKECVNQFRNNPVTSTLKWDGDTLVIDSKVRMGENDVNILDRWTLSADGKTLTMARRFTGTQGEMIQKLVMEKQ